MISLELMTDVQLLSYVEEIQRATSDSIQTVVIPKQLFDLLVFRLWHKVTYGYDT